MDTELRPPPAAIVLSRPTVWFMALAAAVGTAAIYPLQPAIATVAGSVHGSITDVGVALACGPVGYLIGLAVLVPLVDRFAPRKVVCLQFVVMALGLVMNAAAGRAWILGIAIGVVGAVSSVGAQLSSVAGRFAETRRRATDLGIVTAGISAGILAGRIVGGWLVELIGWRGMILVFASACAILAVAALVVLPGASGTVNTGYLATLRGIPGLYLRWSALRLAAGRGALWFFAFCAIWSGLAVALSQPPYSFSPEQIGLYALAGLAGIGATRIAGAWTDRVGAHRVVVIGLAMALVASLGLCVALSNSAVVFVCLGLFDAGLFAAQVANQSTVLAIQPNAPAQFNSAYMVVYFVGGSIGTAFGATAVEWFGWAATAAVAAGAIALAELITVAARSLAAR
ncbi:MFS transporter [Mycobacterium sp. NPDC050853]|uniref:MFS transporter n=1 Tax=Mycobacterium sp. NPDC050853 TaxID=3155160 RepID=UPI0033DE8B8D